MKAIVVYVIDEAVAETEHEGKRIDIKIHKDGRGHIVCDRNVHLYRRVERISLIREEGQP